MSTRGSDDYLNDQPVEPVANALGIAVGAAKVHLYRGRAHLAALLKEGSEGR